MKKGIVTLVFVAVLVLGSYFVMGMMAENNIKGNIRAINQIPNVNVQLNNYQKGWFKSKADLAWAWEIPARAVMVDGKAKQVPRQVYKFDMPLTIKHGPIIMSGSGPLFGLAYAATRIDLPQKYGKTFDELFSEKSTKPFFDISLFVHYLGGTNMKFGIPAFNVFPKKGEGEFAWMGLKSQSTISANQKDITGNLAVEGLKFVNKKATANVEKFTSEYNMTQDENGLWLGAANFIFPGMDVTKDGQKKLQVVNFKMTTDSDVTGGLFSSTVKSQLDKLVVDGKEYGPGVIDIALKNLDAKILGKINQQINQMNAASDRERQMMMFKLLPELPKLVANGAVFEISEVSFAMPQGKIDAKAKVSLPQGVNGNPMMLMQKVKATADIQVPVNIVKEAMRSFVRSKMKNTEAMEQALAKQMQQAAAQGNTTAQELVGTVDVNSQVNTKVEQQLAGLVQAGVLQLKGEMYVLSFNYENGQLTLNGKPFNPRMMQQR